MGILNEKKEQKKKRDCLFSAQLSFSRTHFGVGVKWVSCVISFQNNINYQSWQMQIDLDI